MRLTVLGCAGSFPGPEAACSAYLVEAENFRLLLDFGTGSLGPLQLRGADVHRRDPAVTHLHGDHIFDACSYVVVRRYAPGGPYPPIPVYAPAGADRLMAAYSAEETRSTTSTPSTACSRARSRSGRSPSPWIE